MSWCRLRQYDQKKLLSRVNSARQIVRFSSRLISRSVISINCPPFFLSSLSDSKNGLRTEKPEQPLIRLCDDTSRAMTWSHIHQVRFPAWPFQNSILSPTARLLLRQVCELAYFLERNKNNTHTFQRGIHFFCTRHIFDYLRQTGTTKRTVESLSTLKSSLSIACICNLR